MNVENAYDRWAELYDTMANKTRDLDLLASKRNLGHLSFQSILKVGCGIGKNTEWLCHKCSKLIAVDFSETMMALARQNVTSKNVEWRKFDISRSWPIEGISFDLITFNLVLEHVYDLRVYPKT
jgi:ubiquinone/menaquinone biosynthesis C-methylase UbiE